MRGILIMSKNERGNDALLKNQRETREAAFLDRMKLQAVFKTRFVADEELFRLYIFSRTNNIAPVAIMPIGHEMMKSNGATENKDYIIEEVEE